MEVALGLSGGKWFFCSDVRDSGYGKVAFAPAPAGCAAPAPHRRSLGAAVVEPFGLEEGGGLRVTARTLARERGRRQVGKQVR